MINREEVCLHQRNVKQQQNKGGKQNLKSFHLLVIKGVQNKATQTGKYC